MHRQLLKIPTRVAMLAAPWCLVWCLAASCSRRDPAPGPVADDGRISEVLKAILSPQPDAPKSQPKTGFEDGGTTMAERYSALTEQPELDPEASRQALAGFYDQWGRQSGEAAVAHAFAHNRSLLRAAFAGWMAADPEEPRSWVLAQAASRRRQLALASGLVQAIPAADHASRAAWAEQFADHPTGARIVSEVAIGWAHERPQQALGWLASLPAGSPRDSGIESVFQGWIAADPQEASSHLTRMPPGPTKNLAISSLAKAIGGDDPEAAQLWVEAIGDEDLRKQTSGLLARLAAGAPSPIP